MHEQTDFSTFSAKKAQKGRPKKRNKGRKKRAFPKRVKKGEKKGEHLWPFGGEGEGKGLAAVHGS